MRFGATAQPLANARGSKPSHDRKGVVPGKSTTSHGHRPGAITKERCRYRQITPFKVSTPVVFNSSAVITLSIVIAGVDCVNAGPERTAPIIDA